MGAERVTRLLGVRYPIVQGGMIWVAGYRLAAAVSEAGGLGLIGSAAMDGKALRGQIQKARELTQKPVGVNVSGLSQFYQEHVQVILEEQVPVVFTAGGNPAKLAPTFKDAGRVVVHVVSTPGQALKCQKVGVDAVVAEGFEAGGHNGREELTTMVLIPQVVEAVTIPVLAAGGIATGAQMAAAFALGAGGVQMGTRFLMTEESHAHANYKKICLEAGFDATMLVAKKVIPVRLLKNPHRDRIMEAEARGAEKEELLSLLYEGRTRKSMHEGDIENGEVEIGQVVGMIKDLPPVAEVFRRMIAEYETICGKLPRSL